MLLSLLVLSGKFLGRSTCPACKTTCPGQALMSCPVVFGITVSGDGLNRYVSHQLIWYFTANNNCTVLVFNSCPNMPSIIIILIEIQQRGHVTSSVIYENLIFKFLISRPLNLYKW